MNAAEKPRIAWFAPLERPDPEHSDGVRAAYACRLLVGHLADRFDIELFSATPLPAETPAPCHEYRSFPERLADHPYDFCVYQIEDGARVSFPRECLCLLPGVALFHDVLSREAAHGGAPDSLPSRNSQSPAGLVADPSSVLVSLCTNPRNRAELERLAPETARRGSYFLPYPIAMLQGAGRPRALYTGDRLLVAFTGSPLIEGRAHYVINALRAHPHVVLRWMVDPAERAAAQALCAELGAGRVELRSPRSPEAWEAIVAESDLALHTYFSAYGDCDPYLTLSMAGGAPAVVNDFAAGRELPDSVVEKIPSGVDEGPALEELFSGSEAVLNRLRAKADEALQYAVELHSAPVVAAELALVLTRHFEALRSRTSEYVAAHRPKIVEGFRRFP